MRCVGRALLTPAIVIVIECVCSSVCLWDGARTRASFSICGDSQLLIEGRLRWRLVWFGGSRRGEVSGPKVGWMMDWRGGFELSFAPSRMFSQSSTTQLITLLLHVLC